MLAVQITSRRTMYVSIIPDTFPNKGGYYCEIFEDCMGKFPNGDSFVVHDYEIPSTITTDKERLARAYKVATEKVKRRYK